MSYKVKEAFYSIQGEGARTGRPAVFCRFSGCNLWSGLEADRGKAVCRFCDTDIVGCDGEGGGKFDTAKQLAEHLASFLPDQTNATPYLVFTGGEPSLQLDDALITAVKARGFEIAVETNGTKKLAAGIDWICVSPKLDTELAVREGDELKLVYPCGLDPSSFETLSFKHHFLQPLDDENRQANTQRAVAYCLEHPSWRLSLQIHKYLGLR